MLAEAPAQMEHRRTPSCCPYQELRPPTKRCADEVLYDWSFHAWVRNRFSLGAGKQLSRKVSLDVYYLRQNASHTVPRDFDTIGVTLKTRF